MPEAHEVDLDLWKKWDAGGRRRNDLTGLLSRFDPLVSKQVAIYRRTNIPDSAIRAKAQLQLVKAFETYDPNKGAKLNTHANWAMQPLKRFITSQQNFAKIPEPMVYRIQEFNMARQDLSDKLGRDPSVMELADELKWPQRHVEKMQKVQRKDLSATMFDIDPALMSSARLREIQGLLPYELTGEENAIYDQVLKSGRPMTTAELAARLNMPQSRVNKARKGIGDKLRMYT